MLMSLLILAAIIIWLYMLTATTTGIIDGLSGFPGPTDIDLFTLQPTQSVKGDKGNKGDTTSDPLTTSSTPGPKGQKGETGSEGKKGEAGSVLNILKGLKGIQGIQGIQGVQGLSGEKGESGGQKGEAGADGSDGSDGQKGSDGPKGNAGTNGTKGEQGDKGESGSDGKDGSKGEVGSEGPKGSDGEKGNTGAQGGDGFVLNWAHKHNEAALDDTKWDGVMTFENAFDQVHHIYTLPVGLRTIDAIFMIETKEADHDFYIDEILPANYNVSSVTNPMDITFVSSTGSVTASVAQGTGGDAAKKLTFSAGSANEVIQVRFTVQATTDNSIWYYRSSLGTRRLYMYNVIVC